MQLTCPPSNPATCGEKNLAPALTIGGTIFFTSYIPPGSGISGCNLSEGTGLLYAVSLQDGTAVEDFDAGNNGNPSGQYLFNSDRSTQLNSPGIPAEVTSIGGGKLLQPDLQIRDTKSKAGYKTFWYHKQN
jgi:type IV pilus assembly protein PilY1